LSYLLLLVILTELIFYGFVIDNPSVVIFLRPDGVSTKSTESDLATSLQLQAAKNDVSRLTAERNYRMENNQQLSRELDTVKRFDELQQPITSDLSDALCSASILGMYR